MNAENVMGIVSLVFWALTVIVTVKYLLLVMRADHQGEGGILALFTGSRTATLAPGGAFVSC